MEIKGPDQYKLSMKSDGYQILARDGSNRFSGFSSMPNLPKLYVVSVDRIPIYVGQTTRSMSARFRDGWKATGATGYWSYKFRHTHDAADLAIWCSRDASKQDIETIEAEIVFAVRCSGQWPLSQTEIHFHPSNEIHRRAAADIMRHYQL